METVDDIIVSDIHLGSRVSRSRELRRTLENFNFKRLILNGDIFDDLNFKRLSRADWDFLSYIRLISNPQSNIEVVWIRGNHDNLFIDVTAHFLGIKVYEEYEWTNNHIKNLALHGDQFDDFIVNNKILTDIVSYLYLLIQKIDSKKQRAGRLVKRLFKTWLRVANKIADKAALYAKTKEVQNIFCGHTHIPSMRKYDGGVTYYNSGCWTDVPSTFITIKGEDIEIRKVN